MKLKHKLGALVAVAVAVAAMALPMAAQAKGIPLLFNTGDELFEAAELPAVLKADPELASGNWKLGFKCQHFGVFYADAWTWDCQKAVVNVEGNTYMDLPAELDGQANFTMSDAKRGFWNHFGVATILAGLALITLVPRLLRGKKDEASAEA